MGQYFYFYNKTKNLKADKIGANYDLGWFPKLNQYSHKEICEIILSVIKEQNWSEDDEIGASGDNGDYVHYHNGNITIN